MRVCAADRVSASGKLQRSDVESPRKRAAGFPHKQPSRGLELAHIARRNAATGLWHPTDCEEHGIAEDGIYGLFLAESEADVRRVAVTLVAVVAVTSIVAVFDLTSTRAAGAHRLVGCLASGPSEVFQGSSSRHELALTFDDGPGDNPPSMDFVRLLARAHVPATFFEVGDQIAEYDVTGSVEKAMLADGDMIADHTWSHPDMLLLDRAEQRAQLLWPLELIRKRTGFTPCLWRPPYGDVDGELVSLARSMGLITVMWDVDPDDWQNPGTAAIYQRVISSVHNGAIVIEHFGGGPRTETLAALPAEIATLRHQGYRFVTVAQLLDLKLVYRRGADPT